MNPLDLLFGQVAGAVQQHADPNTPGPAYNANPVLSALSGLFQSHANQSGQQFSGYQPDQQYENHGPNIGSMLGGLLGGGALGSLAGGLLGGGGGGQQQGGMGNVQDASQDPYGDPADQGAGGGSFGNVQDASQDPYGDPADQR